MSTTNQSKLTFIPYWMHISSQYALFLCCRMFVIWLNVVLRIVILCVKHTVNKHMYWKIFQWYAMIFYFFSDDFRFIRKLKCQKMCTTRAHYNWNRPKSNFWKKTKESRKHNIQNCGYKVTDFRICWPPRSKNRKQFFEPNAFKNRKNCKMTKNDRFLLTSENAGMYFSPKIKIL